MKAHDTRHLRLCSREFVDALDGLPADPDAEEFAEYGDSYAELMSPPDRWLWIPAG